MNLFKKENKNQPWSIYISELIFVKNFYKKSKNRIKIIKNLFINIPKKEQEKEQIWNLCVSVAVAVAVAAPRLTLEWYCNRLNSQRQ